MTTSGAPLGGKDKIAGTMSIVTGGASGIGLTIATELLRRGGNVALVDLRESPAAKALIEQYGEDRVVFVRNDVSIANPEAKKVREYGLTLKQGRLFKELAELKSANVGDDDNRVKTLRAEVERTEATLKDMPPSVEEAMTEIMKSKPVQHCNGRVDFLINNAGIQIQKPFEAQTPDDFNLLMGINYFGKVNWARAALPEIRKHGGHVINTSSVHGHVGSDERTPYTSAMHATIAFTKSLAADEAKYGVQVHSISPAFIDTPLAEGPLRTMVAAGKFPGATPDEQMKAAVAWRLQYQGGEWIKMDDVQAAYMGLLDGTVKLETGADMHGPQLTRGYIDQARQRNGAGGIAIFERGAQTAVTGLNHKVLDAGVATPPI